MSVGVFTVEAMNTTCKGRIELHVLRIDVEAIVENSGEHNVVLVFVVFPL